MNALGAHEPHRDRQGGPTRRVDDKTDMSCPWHKVKGNLIKNSKKVIIIAYPYFWYNIYFV